jgi:hypothetical protein
VLRELLATRETIESTRRGVDFPSRLMAGVGPEGWRYRLGICAERAEPELGPPKGLLLTYGARTRTLQDDQTW